MSLDAATNAVYEAKASAWTAARAGKDITPPQRLLDRLGDDASTGPILDLGCGPGYHAAELPPGVIGLDPARAMLDLLRDRVSTALPLQGEAAQLPFATGSLAGAIASAVYVHIDRPALPMALAELHRVLAVDAPAELVLFGGDQDLTEMTTGDFSGRRFALWDDDHLAAVIEGAGFVIEQFIHRETSHWPALSASVRRVRTLPDTVGPGMALLVCGLNPSLHSADLGVGFGYGGNRFWPAALAAGIVSIDRDARHTLQHHGIGMTDLVKRATPRAAEIDRDEYRTGVARVELDGARDVLDHTIRVLGWPTAPTAQAVG